MIERICRTRRRGGEGGFTLIELLVVIAILGILAGVVVFSTRGVNDRGEEAADAIERRTVRTAQEAFFAERGRYAASTEELADEGFLSGPSEGVSVHITDPEGTDYMLGGDVLTLSAGTGNGYPTPFQSLRGPGNLNANYLFDPLLWRDSTGEPIPWLATAWERSPDGLEWTFTLRDGVKWQDGQAFTADDVVFTFDYYKNPLSCSANPEPCVNADQVNFLRNRNSFIRDEVVDVVKDPVDPRKVTFVLDQPVNTFMTSLAQRLLILPEHVWSTIKSPRTAAPSEPAAFMGTGAYILQDPTSYNPATGVARYKANPNFFLGQPFVKELRFVTVSDSIAALKTGQVSAGGVGSEESVTQDEIDQLAGFNQVQNPGGWNRALHFNGLKGFPFDNKNFRKAVALTVDRAALLQNIVGGRGQMSSMGGLAPSHSYLAPGLPTYPRDVNASKALLDGLGIVDTNGDGIREVGGSGTNFKVTLYTSDRFSTQTVEAVQQYLSDVGLSSDYVVEASGVADTRAENQNYEMAFVGYGNLTAEADQLRTRFVPSPEGGGFSSVWGWNPTTVGPETGMTYEELAAVQLVEPDETERRRQLHDM
ncbi:MAG TPA: ABC transporter substrate-binding protein, partial [Acidimicrobiales bacterium]|nr:ABC transporter substrate-binding protein [Acidimicrobiales bacterium]